MKWNQVCVSLSSPKRTHQGKTASHWIPMPPQIFCPSPVVSALKVNILDPSGKPKPPRPLPKTGFPHIDNKSLWKHAVICLSFLGPEEQESAAWTFLSNSKGRWAEGKSDHSPPQPYSESDSHSDPEIFWDESSSRFFFSVLWLGPRAVQVPNSQPQTPQSVLIMTRIEGSRKG